MGILSSQSEAHLEPSQISEMELFASCYISLQKAKRFDKFDCALNTHVYYIYPRWWDHL